LEVVTGKTIYLHLLLVRLLLEGTPVLYQAKNGTVIYLGETVERLEEDDDFPEHLMKPHQVLIDFDGNSTITEPSSVVEEGTECRIIVASSPTSSVDKKWAKQLGSQEFILHGWDADEFWTAL
jgi:hypothetical protein